MRQLVFILLVSLAFVSGKQKYSDDNSIETWSYLFNITIPQIRACIDESEMTPKDEDSFVLYLAYGRANEYEEYMDRVSCAIACFAQKGGLMVGSKIQKEDIKEMFSDQTPERQCASNLIIDVCSERVKHITNECEVTKQFMVCLKDYGTRPPPKCQ